MFKRIFYGPGDWLATCSTARQRRAAATWVLIFWIFPGLPMWLWLRNAIWFIGLMSIIALWLSAWAMVGTETPVEEEKDKKE
jgi:hypothetical protein